MNLVSMEITIRLSHIYLISSFEYNVINPPSQNNYTQ